MMESVVERLSRLEDARLFVKTAQYADLAPINALRIDGGDQKKFFFVEYLFWNDAGTRFNCTIKMADDINGTNAVRVCSYATWDVSNYRGPTLLRLYPISAHGIMGSVVVDFGDGSGAMRFYNGTPTTGGILARNIFPGNRTIYVGSNGSDYPNIQSAIFSLYDQDAALGIGTETIVRCPRATPQAEILIKMEPSTYIAQGLRLPDHVSLRGAGMSNTRLVSNVAAPSNHAPIIMPLNGKVEDLTIESITGGETGMASQYAIHVDNFNRGLSSDALIPIRKELRRVGFVGGEDQLAHLVGGGLSSNETVLIDGCVAYHKNPAVLSLPYEDISGAAFAYHPPSPLLNPQPPVNLSYHLEMHDCESSDPVGLFLRSIGSPAPGTVTLYRNSFRLVIHRVTAGCPDLAADRYNFTWHGSHDGAVDQYDADMTVLATTAGLSPSGSAAQVLFGSVNELGHGEKLVIDGTAVSLGARLGNCIAANKSLTIGGQTAVFNKDYTGVDDASILIEIASAITANPISKINISKWANFPYLGNAKYGRNETGQRIEAGKFLTVVGANGLIALADGEDRIAGVMVRPTLTGQSTTYFSGKKIAAIYVPGAIVDGVPVFGEFGITNGDFDLDADHKVGLATGDGVLELYK